MSKKTRKTFLGKTLEGLEGRALLSGLSLHMPTVKVHGIHVQVVRHKTKAHTAAIVPGGPVSTTYTTPAKTGAVNSNPSVLRPGTGNARVAPVTPAAFANPRTSTTSTTTTSVPLSSLNSSSGPGSLLGRVNLTTGGVGLVRSVPFVTTGMSTIQAASIAGADASNSLVSSTPGSSALAVQSPIDSTVAMPPTGMFGATLTGSEVASFKTAIDTFATNYTSGADAAKDTAAVTALQTGLNDVALSVWSRGNVASKASVAQFQSAADRFASSYTSGQNPTQDAAAWKSLQTAMNTLGSSLTGPSVDPTMNAMVPGIFRLTSIPDASMGNMLGGLTGNGTISAGDVTRVKTAVDTFAMNYTSGANTTTDQAAEQALQATIDDVSSKYWQAMALNSQGPASVAVGSPSATPFPLPPWMPLNTTNFTTAQTTSTTPVTTTTSGTPNGIG